MAIIEKEKALDVVRQMVADGQVSQEVAEKYFPELKESEDEKIRKAIVKMISDIDGGSPFEKYGIIKKEALAWLEKQGEKGTNGNEREIPISEQNLTGKVEQKPWSEEDEENLKWFEKFFRAESVIAEGRDIPQDRYLWLKNLKGRVQPKKEWSDEDEQYLLVCKNALAKYQTTDKWDAHIISHWLEDKLKSIRPLNRWRPSDGELECLGYAIEKAKKDWSPLINNRIYLTLKALKEQLLKLREE